MVKTMQIIYFIFLVTFINLPSLLSGSGKGFQMSEENVQIVFDFNDPENHKEWSIINDGVMGGISQSEMIASDSTTVIFQGNVSLENNGGFASVRTSRHTNLGNFTGIELRVRGDGKKYQFRVRVDNRFDGISYRNIFATKNGQWQNIRLPFDEFVPVFRGRILDDQGLLAPEEIRQLGFLIGDKQAGEFRLEIDWIKVYK